MTPPTKMPCATCGTSCTIVELETRMDDQNLNIATARVECPAHGSVLWVSFNAAHWSRERRD